MALIKCNECGHEISDKAQSCPSCGSPSTFSDIKIKTKAIENQLNTVNHLQVDPIKIKAAGKCFRSIVNNILFLLICDSIGAFAVFKNLKDGENLNMTFLFIGVVNLILYIFILYNIYEAGNNLENSVIKKSIIDKAENSNAIPNSEKNYE